jgi:hypothetical protein
MVGYVGMNPLSNALDYAVLVLCVLAFIATVITLAKVRSGWLKHKQITLLNTILLLGSIELRLINFV